MELLIYEDIGYTDWEGNGLTALSFNADLAAIPGNEKTLNIRINSYGGLVSDGIAIFNSIRRFSRNRAAMGNPITINSIIEGFAYSSAATIAMAGDKVFMGKGTTLMIHNAAGFVWGDVKAMRQEADLLEKYNGQIAKFYADKSGKKVADILELMDTETYFTPEEAISMKLCDGLEESVVANFKQYDPEDLETIKQIQIAGGYDNFMGNRIRNRTQKQRIDKAKPGNYNTKNQVDLLSRELDLLEAELAV